MESMKLLKLGVLICGAVGLAGIWMNGFGAVRAGDKNMILLLVGFGLPVVMALLGLVKPPLQAWQAAVCLAGFALAAIRLRIWETIKLIAREPTEWQLMIVGAGLGVILALIAVIRPESGA
jgi:amino acid transporter